MTAAVARKTAMVVVRNIIVDPIAGRPTWVRAWPKPSKGVKGADEGLVAGVGVGGPSMPKRVTVMVSVTVRGIAGGVSGVVVICVLYTVCSMLMFGCYVCRVSI